VWERGFYSFAKAGWVQKRADLLHVSAVRVLVEEAAVVAPRSKTNGVPAGLVCIVEHDAVGVPRRSALSSVARSGNFPSALLRRGAEHAHGIIRTLVGDEPGLP
jgi:hypothetical protein